MDQQATITNKRGPGFSKEAAKGRGGSAATGRPAGSCVGMSARRNEGISFGTAVLNTEKFGENRCSIRCSSPQPPELRNTAETRTNR